MWAGQTVSLFGDGVHNIALAWLVLSVTGSPLALGTVLITGTVPRTALMVLGGALSDWLSPRTMVIATNAIRALLAFALAALVATAALRVWELYVIEFLFGAADGLCRPAISAAIPEAVPHGELVAANAMIGASEQASMIGGPAAGGILVAVFGTPGAFAINAISFVAAAAGAAPIPSRRSISAERGILALVVEGISSIRSDREMRAVFLLTCAAAASGGAVFVIGLPTLARTRLGMGAFGLGLISAAWGVGQLGGALGAARTGLPNRWGWLLIATSIVDACVYFALSATASAWLVVGLLIPFGVLVAYSSDVARPVWIQRHSPPGMVGRAFSLLELPYYSVAPVGMLIFGAIGARSLGLAFVAAAGLSLVTALFAVSSSTIRRLAI